MQILYKNLKNKTEFSLSFQYWMLADIQRVNAYKKALEKVVTATSLVFDLGTGTGILAALAAQAGAQKVIALEANPKMTALARKLLKKFSNVEVVQTNLFDFKPRNKADIVVAELISTACIVEEQVPAMNYANKCLLKKEGVFVPKAMENKIQLSHFNYDIYGINLKIPFLWTPELRPIKQLSTPTTYDQIAFDQIVPLSKNAKVAITPIEDGVSNCVTIKSFITMSEDIVLKPRYSITPPAVVPLKKPIKIHKDQPVNLEISWSYHSDWSKFSVEVR